MLVLVCVWTCLIMITEQQLHHLQKVLFEMEASFLTIITRIKLLVWTLYLTLQTYYLKSWHKPIPTALSYLCTICVNGTHDTLMIVCWMLTFGLLPMYQIIHVMCMFATKHYNKTYYL